MFAASSIRSQIERMCSDLSADPLLVQGAGGNVSWKHNNTLWIKASGTWLSDAEFDDIFIPTDLNHIRGALDENDFTINPIVTSESNLKPSIETLLHALMPQRIVIHLHAIDVLAYLVRNDCELEFQSLLPKNFNYAFVKYCKPGEDLAKKVYEAIQLGTNINMVFLQNHGLVLAGDTVSEVMELLGNLLGHVRKGISVRSTAQLTIEDKSTFEKLADHGYIPSELTKLNDLAVAPHLSYLVENKWALFPDHVVFLGAQAFIGDCDELDSMLGSNESKTPPFIFCKGVGTFQHIKASRAQMDQLACFYDVAVRQLDPAKIVDLSKEDISALLDWEAEKYRVGLSK